MNTAHVTIEYFGRITQPYECELYKATILAYCPIYWSIAANSRTSSTPRVLQVPLDAPLIHRQCDQAFSSQLVTFKSFLCRTCIWVHVFSCTLHLRPNVDATCARSFTHRDGVVFCAFPLSCHNLSSYHFTVSHFQSCNTHRQVDATETLPLFHPIFYENTSTRLAPINRSTYGRGT